MTLVMSAEDFFVSNVYSSQKRYSISSSAIFSRKIRKSMTMRIASEGQTHLVLGVQRMLVMLVGQVTILLWVGSLCSLT